jgi:hypothetical protein
MEWAEDNDTDCIFGLPGHAVLDALVAEAADNPRFCHATSSEAKLRTFVSFMCKAGSWQQARKVVARLKCSLHYSRSRERPACARRSTRRSTITRTSTAYAGRWS